MRHRGARLQTQRGRVPTGQRAATPLTCLGQYARDISTTAVIAGICCAVVVPTAMAAAAPLLLVVGFILGLPHGAVDHLVPFWPTNHAVQLRPLSGLLIGYLAAAAVTWTGLQLLPHIVLPMLLMVSVWHFGIGDLMAARDQSTPDITGSRPRRVVLLVVDVVARGGPVLAGPLAFWPQQTHAALTQLDPDSARQLASAAGPLAIAVGACTVLSVLGSLHHRDRRTATDTVLIAALFITAPPIAAFGIYFGLWHGLRHTARLIAKDPRNTTDLHHHHYRAPIWRFIRSAAAPTIIALTTVAALILLGHHHAGLTRPIFSLLFSLTAPHLVIVALLDHQTNTPRQSETRS